MVAQLIDDGVATRRVKETAITPRKSCHSFARQPQTEMTLGLTRSQKPVKTVCPGPTTLNSGTFALNAPPLIRSIKCSPVSTDPR